MAFDDPEAIRELFSTFGTISVRRMFGGHGVFADGIMFALESDGELYLKADDLTIPKLAAENSEPFVYKAKGREIALSYWKLPERLYDEPDEFAGFARDAFGAAQRAASGKKPKTKKAPKPEPGTRKKPKRR
ncbi:MAG: TfoX/Sxy family protein [Xanthobacteraceae bacterium]|nr:TfoX/Sxy family protein [Xanthobacteraceae bacterium]